MALRREGGHDGQATYPSEQSMRLHPPPLSTPVLLETQFAADLYGDEQPVAWGDAKQPDRMGAPSVISRRHERWR
jgi:hypothetical protein